MTPEAGRKGYKVEKKVVGVRAGMPLLSAVGTDC